MYGLFMKYMQPGSVRISSEGGGDLSLIVFNDPSGRIVLVIVNITKAEIPVSVSCNVMTASVWIEKNPIKTIIWEK